MKLISMTDFVLGTEGIFDKYEPLCLGEDVKNRYKSITNYAKFLKQPLTLGMFIPCDEDGKPLERPFNPRYLEPQEDLSQEDADFIYEKWGEYQKAKEKVLFEGINAIKATRRGGYHVVRVNDHTIWLSWNKSKNIEDLLKHDIDLTLTPNAIKQIGL